MEQIGSNEDDWICGYTPKNKDKAIYNNTLKCNCVLAIRIHDCSFDWFLQMIEFFLNFVWSHFQAIFKPCSSSESRCIQAVSSDTTLPSRWQSARRPAESIGAEKNLCIKSSNSHLIESMTSIKSSLFVHEILYIIYIILYIIYIIDYRYYTYSKYIYI
jgi:hypothetical protein